MAERRQLGGLLVADALAAFVRDEALPGTGVREEDFWSGAARMFAELGPRLRQLLAERERLQRELDAYHQASPGAPADPAAYQSFLRSIGYLVDEPDNVTISTPGVDPEIATICGPQLVVPLTNARYAINAANARWGSLYDALYGTDAIDVSDGRERSGSYNPVRGAAVIAWARDFLDRTVPLAGASHADVTRYCVTSGALLAEVLDGPATTLRDPAQFVGYQGDASEPTAVLLRHHGLGVLLRLDRNHPIGAADRAGVCDVVLESAVTAIMDLEDAVAAVDTEDKIVGYRNWLGLMRRDLTAEVVKGDHAFTRVLADDIEVTSPDGERTLTVPGRALLLVRHVGHHMMTDAVLDAAGEPVPEGILDALITGLGSLHEVRGPGAGHNSRTGSIYVVKPKLHGPDEVAVACEILARTEEILGLPPLTIKIGVMDEERRTSANLRACVAQARDRIAFVNTGFLDRTGDEIRTSMFAGPVPPKGAMKTERWFTAYEARNVEIAIACGFRGKAQIGKGMWAAPDAMAAMLRDKRAQLEQGASCAWVPSPTAATLHATHYHDVDVPRRQEELAGSARTTLEDMLTISVGDPTEWDDAARQAELDTNVQSVLGYVVRWVAFGIGCSKVPDLTGTALMEDRATCRISSQHVTNWLTHGVVTVDQVEEALRRIAVVVDQQNADDPAYRPMAPAYDSPAFLAARELLLGGLDAPSGYTEPVLHRRRLQQKSLSSSDTQG